MKLSRKSGRINTNFYEIINKAKFTINLFYYIDNYLVYLI